MAADTTGNAGEGGEAGAPERSPSAQPAHPPRPRIAGIAAVLGSAQFAPWLYAGVFFALWEVAVRLFAVPVYLLPAPTVVVGAIIEYWSPLWKNALVTLVTTMAGFAIAIVSGLVLGLLVGGFRTVNAGLYPLLVAFNCIPKVALVPILVIWFGIGTVPAILTAFLISFFPVLVNVATGVSTIEPETEDVLRALGASRWDVMTKIGIPRAMPYFFGSLKIAITLAFVGTVIAEITAANAGLGHLMISAQSQFNVPLVFAGLAGLAVEGIVMYAIMARIEARTTGWARRSGQGT